MALALGLALPAGAALAQPAAPAAGMPKQRPAGESAACRTGPFALRAEDAANVPPLRPDEPVCLRLRPRQSAFFRVAPEAGGFYTVSTRRLARNTDTVLEVLDAQSRVLAQDDDGGGEELASSIEVGPDLGASLLRARTLEDQGGAFELLLVRDAPRPPPDFPTSLIAAAAQPPLAAGQEVTLRLRRGQSAYYALPAERAGLVARTLKLQGETDTVLALLDANGTQVDEDDDGGEGNASALPLDSAPAGPLFLRASVLGNAANSFDLTLRREAPPPPPDFPTTLEEARRQDPLPADGTRAITLRRRQQAIFALPADQALVIQTRNLERGTDTVLALLDADGEVLQEDDDGGSDLASRIATASAGGRAAFVRASTLNGGTGSFDLVVRPVGGAVGAGPAPSIEEAARRPTLLPGEAVAVQLEAGQAAVFALPHDGRPALALTFDLQNGADTVLELLGAEGEVLEENDDADGGLGSRLLAGPQPRPAFLRATGSGGAAASFSLVIVRPVP
jgi:hypothetical protein